MISYYVYELIDPRDGLPFYVGKGNGDRMYKHKKQAFQPKGSKINPYKSNKIRQIIESGNDLQYKKYNCNNELDAFGLERKLIIRYGKRVDKTGMLTNLTNGGEGHTGGHIPVKQYDLFGEYIQTHRSAKDAALFLGKMYYSQITGACRGKETSAFGYLWSYVDGQPKLRTKIKPVFQWSLGGELVQKFISVIEAAKTVEADPSGISKAIKTNRQSMGFIWSFDSKFPGATVSKRLKRIKHINTGMLYESVTAASKATAHTVQSICAVCSKKRKNVGEDIFCYVDDSDQC